MSDSLITRVETMIATIEYAQFHRTSPAYPDAVVKATIRELLAALESARSYKSLPVGMVWQDYYSPDDVCKIREPLDAEVERLRAALDDRHIITDHYFLPVAGHPDDDECTYRSDGSDETYCGQPESDHAWSDR